MYITVTHEYYSNAGILPYHMHITVTHVNYVNTCILQ